MPHNQANRIEALEKELPTGRTIYVWDNGGPDGEAAIAAARAKCGAGDTLHVIRWQQPQPSTLDQMD
jgi:hypothetical protein